MATLNDAIHTLDGTTNSLAKMHDKVYQVETRFEKMSASAVKAGSVVGSLFQKIMGKIDLEKIMNMSDEYGRMKAKLDVMNDGMQNTAALQSRIYGAAQRSGQQYDQMANFASQIGSALGGAFSSNTEAIAFAEQIGKHLQIAGADASSAGKAMEQLGESLADGTLDGKELQFLMQTMPTAADALGKSLNRSSGELMGMANQGGISADQLKTALGAAASETEDRFRALPLSFETSFTRIGNMAGYYFSPIGEALGGIVNNGELEKILMKIAPYIQGVSFFIAGAIYNIGDVVKSIMPLFEYVFGTLGTIALNSFSCIASVASTVFPVLMGLLAGYAAYLLLANAVWLLVNAGMIKNEIQTLRVLARQQARNAQLLATIAIESAWAAITGAVAIAQAFLGAVIAGTLSPVILLGMAIAVVIGIFVFWMMKTQGLRNVIASVFATIIQLTEDLVNGSIGMINQLLGVYNKVGEVLGKLFGFKFEKTQEITYKANFQGFKNEGFRLIDSGTMDDFKTTIGIDKIQMPSGGWDMGSNFPPMNHSMEKPLHYPGAIPGSHSNGETGGSLEEFRAIRGAMETSSEDLKVIRTLAEQEAQGPPRVAEIKVDMSGMQNHIHNEMDVEAVIGILHARLNECLDNHAEGVHYA